MQLPCSLTHSRGSYTTLCVADGLGMSHLTYFSAPCGHNSYPLHLLAQTRHTSPPPSSEFVGLPAYKYMNSHFDTEDGIRSTSKNNNTAHSRQDQY